MTSSGPLKNFCNWVYSRYAGEQGKMLIHTGVLGWILSAAAQVGAIVINDKIPQEQKKFLVPQEIADAAINIISFYAVTSTIKNFALKLVSTGKIASKPVRKFLSDNLLSTSHVGKLSFNIKNLTNFDKIKEPYDSFKNGADVIGTTVGSILSCNIITPILRNKFAAHKQQQSLAYTKPVSTLPNVAPRGISIGEFKVMATINSRAGMKI